MATRLEVKPHRALNVIERDAWRAFVEADPNLSTPYTALGFADAVAAARQDVSVVVQSRGGAPEAFLPLHRAFGGHARPLAGPLGDHHGVVAAPDAEIDLRAMMRAAGVGAFDFHGALGRQAAFSAFGGVEDGSWVADLSDGFDAFVTRQKKLGGNTFRTIHAAHRKIEEREGAVTITFDDKRPETLAALYRWKSAQYRATGHFDVFSADWTRRLVDTLLHATRTDCRGVLSSLEIDGRIAAVHFGIMGPRAMHYWFPAYDPDFSKLAPGNALKMAICAELAERGVGELHLGPGDFRYKAALGSWQIPLRQGCVARFAPMGLARQACAAVEETAERLPLGALSGLPGKAFRRIDRIAAFRAA